MIKEIEVSEAVTIHLLGQTPIAGRHVSRPARQEDPEGGINPLGYHIKDDYINTAWDAIYGKNIIGIIEIFSVHSPTKSEYAGLYFGEVLDPEWLRTQISFFEKKYRLGIDRKSGKGVRWLSFFIVDSEQ